MNQDFQAAGGDAEPDMNDTGEQGEGELTFPVADYPELEGLKNAPVKLRCEGTVNDDGSGNAVVSITPGSCEFETEGPASREMKRMSQQDSMPAPMDNAGSGEDF